MRCVFLIPLFCFLIVVNGCDLSNPVTPEEPDPDIVESTGPIVHFNEGPVVFGSTRGGGVIQQQPVVADGDQGDDDFSPQPDEIQSVDGDDSTAPDPDGVSADSDVNNTTVPSTDDSGDLTVDSAESTKPLGEDTDATDNTGNEEDFGADEVDTNGVNSGVSTDNPPSADDEGEEEDGDFWADDEVE